MKKMSSLNKVLIVVTLLCVIALGTAFVASAATGVPIQDLGRLLFSLGEVDAKYAADNSESIFLKSNNITITQAEVDTIIEKDKITGYNRSKKEVVEVVLKPKALYHYAVSKGYDATDEEVNAFIAEERERFLIASNRENFLEYLKGTGQTEDEYWDSQFESYKTHLAVSKLEEDYRSEYFNGRDGITQEERENYQESFREWLDEAYHNVLIDEQIDLSFLDVSDMPGGFSYD